MQIAAEKQRVVFLSSITSDIGVAMAKRYVAAGSVVAGTYRATKLLPELSEIPAEHLFFCDLADRESIENSVAAFAATNLRWDTLVFLAAMPQPLAAFFHADFDVWSHAMHVNAIEQLRVLHAMFPLRASGGVCNVVFFSGPGTNKAVTNFSAAAASKHVLLKMCELLDAENPDLNVFIVGPGWTRTKTHNEILSDPCVSLEKKRETELFLAQNEGTSMDDIFRSIEWMCAQGREVAGGRNFSVVHDPWGTGELASQLANDREMYKMRRSGNEWRP
jgi:NAD(P)-dependent dehydrogenase (short-subunit alcohol dehydrogenase family)